MISRRCSALVPILFTVAACSDVPTEPVRVTDLISARRVELVEVCHLRRAGWKLLNVPAPAVRAHLKHGDGHPFLGVPGMPGFAFNGECVPVAANSIWIEVGDAGDLRSTFQLPVGIGPLTQIDGTTNDVTNPQGPGNDHDMYLIRIHDPAAFVATTVAASTNLQLFLFELDGRGVTHNDNDPTGASVLESRITGQYVPGPGFYFLAVSRFDRDPTAGGSEIWTDLPLNTERAPDGPAAGGIVDGWNGTQLSFVTIPYSIFLAGASYAPPTLAPIFAETGDAGDLPGTSQTATGTGPLLRIDGVVNDPTDPAGPGNDRDMYLIQIDDPSAFEATTLAPALNLQLFLFDLGGQGIAHNDNDPTGVFILDARLSGAFVPAPGQYYLAVSRFDRDPTAGGSEIWSDLPLNVERAADGPGAGGAVDGWNGSQLSFVTSAYTIVLSGASRVP